MITRAVVFVTFATFGAAAQASAQTLNDVLTFLLTNRTVATDDFTRDQQAARAASRAEVSLRTEKRALIIGNSERHRVCQELTTSSDCLVERIDSRHGNFSEQCLNIQFSN